MYSVGQRIYHPYLGRFMQRDPGGALADPMARGNAYTYAAGNPAMFADRDGQIAAFLGGAARTAGEGLGIVAFLAGLTFLGPPGMALAAVAAIGLMVVMAVNYCIATSRRIDEARAAGEGYTPMSFIAGATDVLGLSEGIEAFRGKRMDSNLPVTLTAGQREAAYGRAFGSLAALAFGGKAFEAVRAIGIWEQGGPVTVELVINPSKHGEKASWWLHAQGHMTIRVIDFEKLEITEYDRIWNGVSRKVERFPANEADLFRQSVTEGHTSSDVTSRYVVSRAVAAAAERRIVAAEPGGAVATRITRYWATDPSLTTYVNYWRTCQTLPGELGLGLWVPVVWTSAVSTLTSLYMSGWIPALAAGYGSSFR